MPVNISSGSSSGNNEDALRQDLGYKYPRDLNLRPDSQLHKKIVDRIITRARNSMSVMSSRHSSWTEIEETLSAYIPADAAEQKVKKKDKRKPISVVVPISYAVMETLLTFLTEVHLGNPIFSYTGVGPEDDLSSYLLEKIIGQQTHRRRAGLALHTMFRSSISHGLAPMSVNWVREEGKITRVRENPLTRKRERVRTTGVKYEGNELTAIDPFLFLPDPSVSIDRIQEGEFVGWIVRDNRMNVLEEEESVGGFNAKYLKFIKGTSTITPSRYSRHSSHRARTGRDELLDNIRFDDKHFSKAVDRIFMYVKLIPKEWELGSGSSPEMWWFEVDGDRILREAQPFDLDHGQFPVVVNAPDYDGFGVTPISKLELVYGLQEICNFLLNSHVANVRKAINDTLVYNPAMIVERDLKAEGPGKLIRLRKRAWGLNSIDQAIKQLQIVDITRQHIQELPIIIDLIEKVTGAIDSVQGVTRKTSERVSATEFSGRSSNALSRLARMSRVTSMMSMQGLGEMFASNTIQLMEEETFINIAGPFQARLKQMFGSQVNGEIMSVSPLELSADFDIVASDQNLTRGRHLGEWLQLFQIISGNEQLTQEFNLPKMFSYIATLMGNSQISDFMRQNPQQPVQGVQILPDAEVAAAADAGDVVPLNALES